jgi:hypothetical protein
MLCQKPATTAIIQLLGAIFRRGKILALIT